MLAGASASRPATSAAIRCGRWEVRATARSCSSGASATSTPPHSAHQRADQRHRAAASDGACGVTAQGRPSNRVAEAASGPERSEPAIGWLPT